MAARSSWKGFLRIRLVSIPVKAYTAATSGAKIQLNQLHRDCHSPVKHRKVCPLHGEVGSESVVSGYNYAKGCYVVIDSEELEKLRRESDKVVEVEGFLPKNAVDPLYLCGKDYFLVPEGPVGQKAYRLIREVMTERGQSALGKIVLTGREQIVLLRPHGRLLVMSILSYAGEVKDPAAFEDEVEEGEVTAPELELAGKLLDAATLGAFDPACYRNEYTARLTELIEAKVEGKEIVAAPEPEEPKVIELLEALRASVARTEEAQVPAPAKGKAAKKRAPSARKRRTAAGRKRKTG
jgi:DNA end-binding protein Ku